MIVGVHITAPSYDPIALESDTDRPGHDYKNFDLPEPRPEICRDACQRDVRCRAFTYISPGIQDSKPHCWLKEKASRPLPAKGMVSGVKESQAR